MIIELKPEQQAILEQAIQSGKTQEEVLDEVFALLADPFEMDDQLTGNRQEISSKIERSLAQAERGEVIPDYDLPRILEERRRSRKIA